MEKLLLISQTRVAEVLANDPQAARFFLDRHLDCVGCRMAPFCTLEEVCRQYELDIQHFLQDLRELEVSHASH